MVHYWDNRNSPFDISFKYERTLTELWRMYFFMILVSWLSIDLSAASLIMNYACVYTLGIFYEGRYYSTSIEYSRFYALCLRIWSQDRLPMAKIRPSNCFDKFVM